MPLVRDSDMRVVLSAAISSQYGHLEHLLVPEVDIFVSLPGRIDALLVADRICGFELKSDVDSLRRLPRQVEIYCPVLERATLVVGSKHVDAASKIVPPWWAIWTVRRVDNGFALSVLRRGRLNARVEPYAVSTFIPRDVLVPYLRTQGFDRLSRLSVYELRRLLVDNKSKKEVLSLARETMLSRGDWVYRAKQARTQNLVDHSVPAGGGSGGAASCLVTSAK